MASTIVPNNIQIGDGKEDLALDVRAALTAAAADINVILAPAASATPTANGDLVVQATSNTSLTFKLKGTDGTVRSGSITLA